MSQLTLSLVSWVNQIILLENLRFNPGETKNDRDFVDKLVKGVDLYVNDVFGVTKSTRINWNSCRAR